MFSSMMRIPFPFSLITLVTVCLAFLGCSKGPKIVPVSGKITIDGKSLTMGVIMVYQNGYRPASASIQNDGSFVFKTLTTADGCVLGEHNITVSSSRLVGGTKAEHFIPARYADLNQSGMKIKIDGKNENLVIDLTWAGSGHTKPYIVGTGG
jgi:hypothetical protein